MAVKRERGMEYDDEEVQLTPDFETRGGLRSSVNALNCFT